MTSPRTNLVAGLAPVAPPCFPTRDIWVEYLKSAVEYGRADHPSPLTGGRGQAASFNYAFDFCADCSLEHSTRMAGKDLCNPLHLRVLGLERRVIPIVAVVVAPTPAAEATCAA